MPQRLQVPQPAHHQPGRQQQRRTAVEQPGEPGRPAPGKGHGKPAQQPHRGHLRREEPEAGVGQRHRGTERVVAQVAQTGQQRQCAKAAQHHFAAPRSPQRQHEDPDGRAGRIGQLGQRGAAVLAPGVAGLQGGFRTEHQVRQAGAAAVAYVDPYFIDTRVQQSGRDADQGGHRAGRPLIGTQVPTHPDAVDAYLVVGAHALGTQGPDLDRGAAAQVHFQAVLAGAAIDQAPVRPSVRQLHALPGRLRIGPELSHLQLQSL